MSPVIGSIDDAGVPAKHIEDVARRWALPVVPIRLPRKVGPRATGALLDACEMAGADIVHSHGYKANILLGLRRRTHRPPLVTTAHGWTATRGLNKLAFYEWADRRVLSRLDGVALVSPHMERMQVFSKRRLTNVTVIENGIPSLQERESLGGEQVGALPPDLLAYMRRRPTLVSIGRLSPEKAQTILVSALAEVVTDGLDVQALMVGEGGERAALVEQINREGLSDRVRLVGYMPLADRLLEPAAAFVMSSLSEGLPLSLLEAMQRRAPVIATRVGGIPAVLAEGARGALVEPGSASSLAAAIRHLIREPASSRKRSEAAWLAVQGQYSAKNMALAYARLYDAALAAHGR